MVAQIVQLAFQDLGALVELKLCKAFGKNRLDLIQWMRLQEIQDHRIADKELAVDGFRVAGKAFRQHVQIDIRRGGDDGKAHEIFPSSSCAAGYLLHLADRQVCEVPRLANAGLRDDDGSRGEIDSGSQGGCGEDGIEAAMPHQFLNGDFPRGQMACVMRSHADALDGRNQRVFGDAGILGDDRFQHGGDSFLARRREEDTAMVEGLHRFIAGAARREKHDSRSQMLVAKRDNQINRMNRGRHAVSFPLQSRPSLIR